MYTIYLITHIPTQRIYVGQTKQTVRGRWCAHVSAAKTGSDYYFSRAILKYGKAAFSLEAALITDSKELADESEKFLILVFRSYEDEFGFNTTFGGEGGSMTESARQKLSNTRRELMKDPARRKALSEAKKGVKFSAEGCRNISLGLMGNQFRKGIPHSAEDKKKISDGLKRAFAEGRRTKSSGLKKGTKLGPMSDEEKRKRSEAMKRVRAANPWSTKRKELESKLDLTLDLI